MFNNVSQQKCKMNSAWQYNTMLDSKINIGINVGICEIKILLHGIFTNLKKWEITHLY